jgi:hypothetical protein
MFGRQLGEFSPAARSLSFVRHFSKLYQAPRNLIPEGIAFSSDIMEKQTYSLPAALVTGVIKAFTELNSTSCCATAPIDTVWVSSVVFRSCASSFEGLEIA